jgi:Putative restriction endonuclease
MTIADSSLKTRRWTRVEYERLIDYGVFRGDEHLELLDGLLVVREPQGSRHSAAVAALCQVLARAFGGGFHVRPQLPLALDDASEPEPASSSFGEGRGTTSAPIPQGRRSWSRSPRPP